MFSIITRDNEFINFIENNKIIFNTLRSATLIIKIIIFIVIQGVGILFRSVISSTLFAIGIF